MTRRAVLFIVVLSVSFLGPKKVIAAESPLKAVMQINNESLSIVIRGLRNAQDIADTAKSAGQQLDLKLVVFGPAVDLFGTSADNELRTYFRTLSEKNDVHFFVDARRLKKIHKGVQNLLPHFQEVSSGAYEVLKLEAQGYLYIKP